MQFPIYIHLHFGRIVCRKSTCDVPLHHQTCAYESEWIHLIYRFFNSKFATNFQVLKGHFQRNRTNILPLDFKSIPYFRISMLPEHITSMFISHFVSLVQTYVCMRKRPVFHLIQSPFPVFGNVAVTYHGSQYTCCRCRVAVRILPSTGRDINGFCKITLSIEQS